MRYCYGCNTVYETKACPHCAAPLAAVPASTKNPPRSRTLLWGSTTPETSSPPADEPELKRDPSQPRRTTMPGIPKAITRKVATVVVSGEAVHQDKVAEVATPVAPAVENKALECSAPIAPEVPETTGAPAAPAEPEASVSVTEPPAGLDTDADSEDDEDFSIADAGREKTVVSAADVDDHTLRDVFGLPSVAEEALAETVERQTSMEFVPDDITQHDVYVPNESNDELLPPWEEAPVSAPAEDVETPTALFNFEEAAAEAVEPSEQAPSDMDQGAIVDTSFMATDASSSETTEPVDAPEESDDPSPEGSGYLVISRSEVSDQLRFYARARARRDAIEAEVKKPLASIVVDPTMSADAQVETAQPVATEPPRRRRTKTPAPVVEEVAPVSQEALEAEWFAPADESAQSADTTLIDVRGLRGDVTQDGAEPKAGQVKKKRGGFLSLFRSDADEESSPPEEPTPPKKKGKHKK